MTRIGYRIAVDDRLYEAHALALDSHASLSVPVNQCRLVMHPDVEVAPGDAITVALARAGGAAQPVFAGAVSAAERAAEGTRIAALGRFVRLVRARVNRSYGGAHAGDIAADVLRAFDIDLGRREPGIAYPGYTIADAQAVYWALAGLAQASGLWFYADRQDRAVFAAVDEGRGEAHVFRHGENILRYALEDREPAVTGVEVHGAGAASFAGAHAHGWPSARPLRAGAGAGTMAPVRDPALRDLASVQTAARALHAQRAAGRRGRVRAGLRADIALGDAIVVSDRHARERRGRVTGVRHRVSKRRGAVTDIDFIATEERS